MHHILALYAAAPPPSPGVFKVAGHVVPSALGQVMHWIAKLFVIIATVLVIIVLKFREKTPFWQLIVVLALGAIALPHTSDKVAKGVSTITSGSAVASTGASIGLILIMGALLVLVVFVPPVLRKRALKAGAPPGEDEE